jgi:hypothetical protein
VDGQTGGLWYKSKQGGDPGYRSSLTLVPELNLGVFVSALTDPVDEDSVWSVPGEWKRATTHNTHQAHTTHIPTHTNTHQHTRSPPTHTKPTNTYQHTHIPQQETYEHVVAEYHNRSTTL